jgi:RNA polymerase sigma factor (sigma-70 family)
LRLGAAAMCGDWYAAEDLVQETLMILHRRWEDIEPPARGAYARAVMSHLITQRHRSKRWKREWLCDELPEPAPLVREEEVANRLAVKEALVCLSARQRNAVYLRYWEGMSTRAIAQALHVPAGTVRSDLARATVRLREVLRLSFPRPGAVDVSLASYGDTGIAGA